MGNDESLVDIVIEESKLAPMTDVPEVRHVRVPRGRLKYFHTSENLID